MSLFQNAVLNKYLKGLQPEKIEKAYQKFTSHFHNPTIQENIRNSKEEQYQGEFLIDLFVNVLGYTKNPTPHFNLTTELKNIKGSKKTDGAILSRVHAPSPNDSSENAHLVKALAVIELKGTNTTDLSKVETQAFGYKNNQPGCNYVITSNFEKLRFYIDNAVDFEEFNLFQLTKERFNLLWLCLSSEYLLKNVPKKIKDESLTQEENVTKKLYKDYASFRNEIFDAIQKENPAYDKLTLFKKTQKLLDRFLFIFFAEDRLLLPPNSIRSIVNQWTDLRDKYDEYFPLYNRFKKYFGYMNTGHKGQQHDIFAYNGGLFAPDEILDNIKINDNLLYKHTLNLSNYDFESEVSVNILGHIFEHSLNDIDEIQAEIQGITTDQSKTKRKKDGVFYTPKYITKYIVDHTVGKLCEEKKIELNIQEAEYEKERKGRKKATIKKLSQKLEEYRKWLLQITICDPACGSGAFLNQALEFLIAEHQYIDELQAKLFGDTMVLSEVENAILENNLFGVDINEESVEIAKLSLWLRTAQKGRKLTSLNSNIKCGNSLIDNPSVAGDKAFHWQKEFPTVFKEKDKKAYHITTALHDSRTSQRMIDYKVRQKRDGGTNPLPNYTKLTPEEEVMITKEIIAIAEEKKLNIMSYNICGDHIHLLLVCEEEEVPKMMQIIKAKTARKINIHRGVTTTGQHNNKPTPSSTTREPASSTREPAPLNTTKEPAPLNTTKEPAPLPGRGKKQNSLWTQKYGCKDIKEDNQLYNTVNYIQTNRTKHELPSNKQLQSLLNHPILNQDYDHVFTPQYTGGFDVVIGNPPYVRQELFKKIKPYLQEHYKCYNSVADLYTYFIEQGINLINENGLFSFILPNKFLKATYGKNIRKVINERSNLELLLDFDDYPVFADATTYPIIYVLNKKIDYLEDSFMYAEINKRDNTVDPINLLESKKHKVPFASLTEDMWNFIDTTSFEILNKLKKNSTTLGKHVGKKIFYGIKTGKNDAFVIDGEKRKKLISKNSKNSERIKVLATGKEVKRNRFDFQDKYLLFTGFDDNIPKEYPDIQEELDKYKEALIKRYDQGENYWNLRACAYYKEMQKPKIIYPRINNRGNFYFDEKGEVFLLDNNFFISTDSKALLALLNSKLVYFYLKNLCTTLQGGFYDFRRDKITTIPVNNNFNSIKKDISVLSDKLIDFTDQSNKSEANFIQLLKSKFGINTISKKLQNWHELSFGEFLKELEKARKKSAKENKTEYSKLSLSEEAEWMQYFNEQKQKATKLKAEIDKTDKEIDQMVYELYGLTADEIKIVEEATK